MKQHRVTVASFLGAALIAGAPRFWQWLVEEDAIDMNMGYMLAVFVSFVIGAILQWWVDQK